ncbi:hypothetical protein C823_007583 [Eubacterium plexicaudatum ASF492]|uniref:Uncharacterized protein n=1 Tax=Eubacterium plexicaudatum ASF492 TaxID=1235802 RepID=N2A4K9_9FIRM|nr:hypothetical protein C823_007583 [Eubacterium plexicaudatum ASF492]
MFKRRKGYTIEFDFPEKSTCNGYSVTCTYKYNKKIDKYALEMELKNKDIGDSFRIDRQEIDTQYISGNKDNIEDNVKRIVQQAMFSGFFDKYIKRYEYTVKCFEKGNEYYEQEYFKNN